MGGHHSAPTDEAADGPMPPAAAAHGAGASASALALPLGPDDARVWAAFRHQFSRQTTAAIRYQDLLRLIPLVLGDGVDWSTVSPAVPIEEYVARRILAADMHMEAREGQPHRDGPLIRLTTEEEQASSDHALGLEEIRAALHEAPAPEDDDADAALAEAEAAPSAPSSRKASAAHLPAGEVLRFVSSVVPADGSAVLCTIVGDSFVKKYKQPFATLAGTSFAKWCKAHTDAFVRKQLTGGHWVIARQTTLTIARPTVRASEAETAAEERLAREKDSDQEEAAEEEDREADENDQQQMQEDDAMDEEDDGSYEERMAQNWELLLALIPPSPMYRVLSDLNEDCLRQTGHSFEAQCACTIHSLVNSQPGLFQTTKRMNGPVTEWLVRRRSEQVEEFPPMKVLATLPAGRGVSSYVHTPTSGLVAATAAQLRWIHSFPLMATGLPTAQKVLEALKVILLQHPGGMRLTFAGHAFERIIGQTWKTFSRGSSLKYFVRQHAAEGYLDIMEDGNPNGALINMGNRWGAGIQSALQATSAISAQATSFSASATMTRGARDDQSTSSLPSPSGVVSSSPSSSTRLSDAALTSMVLRCMPLAGHSMFIATAERAFYLTHQRMFSAVAGGDAGGITMTQFLKTQPQAFDLSESDDGRIKVGRREDYVAPTVNTDELLAATAGTVHGVDSSVPPPSDLKLALLQLFARSEHARGIRRFDVGNEWTCCYQQTFSSSGAQQGVWRYLQELASDGLLEMAHAHHSSGPLLTLTPAGRAQADASPSVQVGTFSSSAAAAATAAAAAAGLSFGSRGELNRQLWDLLPSRDGAKVFVAQLGASYMKSQGVKFRERTGGLSLEAWLTTNGHLFDTDTVAEKMRVGRRTNNATGTGELAAARQQHQQHSEASAHPNRAPGSTPSSSSAPQQASRSIPYERSCRHFRSGFCGHGDACKYGHLNPPASSLPSSSSAVALSVTDLRKLFRSTFEERVGKTTEGGSGVGVGVPFFALGRVVSWMTKERPWCTISPALKFEDFFQQRLDAGEYVASNPTDLGQATIYLGSVLPPDAPVTLAQSMQQQRAAFARGPPSLSAMAAAAASSHPAHPLRSDAITHDSITQDLLAILPPDGEWMDAVQIGSKFARLHGFQPFVSIVGMTLRVFVHARGKVFDTMAPSGSVFLVRRRVAGGSSAAGRTVAAGMGAGHSNNHNHSHTRDASRPIASFDSSSPSSSYVGGGGGGVHSSFSSLPTSIVDQILHVIPQNGFVLASQLGNSFRGQYGRSLESSLQGKKLITILQASPDLFVMTEPKPGRMEVYRRANASAEVLAAAITDLSELSQQRHSVDKMRDPANIELVMSLLPADGTAITGSELGHAFTRRVGHSFDKHLGGFKLLKPFLEAHPERFQFAFPIPGTMMVSRVLSSSGVGGAGGSVMKPISALQPTHAAAAAIASTIASSPSSSSSAVAPPSLPPSLASSAPPMGRQEWLALAKGGRDLHAKDHPRLHDPQVIQMMTDLLPGDCSFVNATELGIMLTQLLGQKFDQWMGRPHMLRPFLEQNPAHFKCDHPNPQMMRVARVKPTYAVGVNGEGEASTGSARGGRSFFPSPSPSPLLTSPSNRRHHGSSNDVRLDGVGGRSSPSTSSSHPSRPTDASLVHAILSQLPLDGSPLIISNLGDRFSRLFQGRKWHEVTGSNTPSFTSFLVARKLVFRTEGSGHTMLVARAIDEETDSPVAAPPTRVVVAAPLSQHPSLMRVLPTNAAAVSPSSQSNGRMRGGGGGMTPSPARSPPPSLSMKELTREVQLVLAHPSSSFGVPLSQLATHFHTVHGRSISSLVGRADFNFAQFISTISDLGSLELVEEHGDSEPRVKLPLDVKEKIDGEEARQTAAQAVAQAYPEYPPSTLLQPIPGPARVQMKKPLTPYAATFTPGRLAGTPTSASSPGASSPSSFLLKPILPHSPASPFHESNVDHPPPAHHHHPYHHHDDLIVPDSTPTAVASSAFSASPSPTPLGGSLLSQKSIPYQLEVLFDLMPPGHPAVRIEQVDQMFQARTRWPFVGNLRHYLTALSHQEFHVYEQGDPPVTFVRRVVHKTSAADANQAYL